MSAIQAISSVVPNPPPELKDVTHLSLGDRTRLWQAAKDLESTFSTYMLQDLKFGATSGNGKESFASDTFGDMFKHSLADQLARSGSVGLARQIYIDSARLAEKAMVSSMKQPNASSPLFSTPTPTPAPFQPNHPA